LHYLSYDIRDLSEKGVPMKKRLIFVVLMMLLIGCLPVSAVETGKEVSKSKSPDQELQEIMKSQGVTDMKSIDCSKVTDKQLEGLGNAVMGVMHPDPTEHEFMDRMMGGEGSQTLKSMHRMMGARYLGCYKGDGSYGMMSPFWGGRGWDGDDYYNYNRRWHMPMMYGYGPYGMMGGFFMWILFLLLLGLVVYFVVRLAKPAGTGETPLDILKKRYAKGEITKEDFEEKKKDLGL
jgi:putative membrane protein